jgi:monoamine oxidase
MPIEPWTGNSVDVAIVGAGAAGVGAARRLQSLRPDLSIVLLEASDRVGGRAHTVHPVELGGLPVDLGCGWLHGARTNAWTKIADEVGLTVDRTPAPWNDGGRRYEDNSDAKAARLAANEYFARLHAYEGAEDAALSAMLSPGNRWNGQVHAFGAFITGAELHQSSIIDFNRYDPGPGPDWRVRQGYGALVATYAAPIPTQIEAGVSRIDHSAGDHIALTTEKGVLRATAVVIAVSTNVLAAGKIAFWPPLPEKIEAASRLPLGLANKLFLHVHASEAFPTDTFFLGSHHSGRTGAYQIKPFGTAVIEAYFAGDLAHDLERQGMRAAFRFAVAELKRAFGSSVGSKVSPAVMSAWSGKTNVGGSYSYATPGASDLRKVLAAPHDDRLFFAGEACSPTRYSTAHGAYESGVAAAKVIAETMV